jgi:hypothetical protein
VDVQEDGVGTVGLELAEGRFRTPDEHGLVAQLDEKVAEHRPDVGFVLNHEDPHATLSLARGRGRAYAVGTRRSEPSVDAGVAPSRNSAKNALQKPAGTGRGPTPMRAAASKRWASRYPKL